MVSEVIKDGHAIHFSNLLHAPLGVNKATQCGNTQLRHHTDMPRRRQYGQGVGDVVLAGQLPIHGAGNLALETHLETRAIGAEQVRLPLPTLTGGGYLRPASHLDHTLERRLGGGMNDQPFARNGAHQMMELTFDGR